MNALPLLVQTLWPGLKLFIGRPNVKDNVTRSQIMLHLKRSCQEDRVRFPASPLEFPEIGYLLLPSRDMADIPLKRRKSSIQPTNQKVLPQGMHMSHMKALPLLVKKSCLRLTFYKIRSNFKVKALKSNVLIPIERPCNKECLCEI